MASPLKVIKCYQISSYDKDPALLVYAMCYNERFFIIFGDHNFMTFDDILGYVWWFLIIKNYQKSFNLTWWHLCHDVIKPILNMVKNWTEKLTFVASYHIKSWRFTQTSQFPFHHRIVILRFVQILYQVALGICFHFIEASVMKLSRIIWINFSTIISLVGLHRKYALPITAILTVSIFPLLLNVIN